MGIRELARLRLIGSAAVTALVGARVRPNQAMQSDIENGSYIVYHRISGATVNSLDPTFGSGMASRTRHCRFQFDIFASSADTVETLAELVKTQMNGWRDTLSTPRVDSFLLDNEIDGADLLDDDDDGATHRITQDYICWYVV